MYASALTAASEPLPKARWRARGAGAALSGWASEAARAGATGCSGSHADRQLAEFRTLQTHLYRLWDHSDVPPWHRELYMLRYCAGGFQSDVLRREAEALAQGTAAVQVAMRAVGAREEVLRALLELRGQYSDEDFSRPAARRVLMDKLLALRSTSVAAVEAVSAWRRSVAPLPGQQRSKGRPAEGISSVANPSARGAFWPSGPDGEDYLLQMARDETVVRLFEGVLELSDDSDPFLLRTAAAAAGPTKIRPPLSEPSQLPRLERAKMLLLEDEIGLSLFSEYGRSEGGSKSPIGRISSPEEGQLEAKKEASLPTGLPTLRHRGSVVSGTMTSSLEEERHSAPEKTPPHLLPFLPPTPSKSSDEQRVSTSVRGSTQLRKVSMLRGEAPLIPRTVEPQWRRRHATINPRKQESEALDVITELHDINLNSMSNLRWKPGQMQNGWKMLENNSKNNNSNNNLQSRLTAGSSTLQQPRSSGSSLASSESGTIDDLLPANEARPPTVDLMRINATFRRYSMDGYVHQDDVGDALKRLGFAHPMPEWTEEAIGQVTAYGTLDPAEFVLFVGAYEDKLRAHSMQEFKKYDADQSGFIDPPELMELLRDMHIEPMSHVLEEVLLEVDQDGSGHLNFEEFFEVIRLLQGREGFTKSEYDQFIEAFHLCDRDKSGEMDDQELMQVLCYLGYTCSPEDAQAVIQEVDFDGTGSMDQHEFLVCMRKLREREMQALKAAMLQHDVDMSGTISAEELQLILYSVGYLPDEQVVQEILEDMGMNTAQCELNFGMLWRFMITFRSREGLCRSDSENVDKAFERYATGNEVGSVYVSKILRFMGFSLSHGEKQHLVSQVDIDGSGALGLFELRKLFRICREQRAQLVKSAFRQYADPGVGVVSLKVVHEALRSIGCIQDHRPLPNFVSDDQTASVLGGLDMRTFFKVASQQFAELETEVRLNGGYTMDELALMKQNFKIYDLDGSGTIQNNELVALVKRVFPDMATDPKLRPQLMEILKEADEDGNGELDFEDFLRLMRTVCELRNRNQLEKEKKAVQDTGFLPHEVHEFREYFQAEVDRSMLLCFEDFKDMIHHICPLGDRNLSILEGMWREALSTYDALGEVREVTNVPVEVDEGGRVCIDFPEFLWLMRQILQTNFGQVLQRTQRRISKLSNSPVSPLSPSPAAAPSAPQDKS